MPVKIRPSTVVGTGDGAHGKMAFVDGDLIAILVEIEGPNPDASRWTIDWMAPAVDCRRPLFTQLEAARLWLSHRYRCCLGRPQKGGLLLGRHRDPQ